MHFLRNVMRVCPFAHTAAVTYRGKDRTRVGAMKPIPARSMKCIEAVVVEVGNTIAIVIECAVINTTYTTHTTHTATAIATMVAMRISTGMKITAKVVRIIDMVVIMAIIPVITIPILSIVLAIIIIMTCIMMMFMIAVMAINKKGRLVAVPRGIHASSKQRVFPRCRLSTINT